MDVTKGNQWVDLTVVRLGLRSVDWKVAKRVVLKVACLVYGKVGAWAVRMVDWWVVEKG